MILTLLMLALLALAWCGSMLVPKLVAALTRAQPGAAPSLKNGRIDVARRAQDERFEGRRARAELAQSSPMSPAPLVAGLASALILGALGAAALMADDVAGAASAGMDQRIYASLRDMRMPTFDRFMVGASGIGDQKVVIPVALAILAVCAAFKRWRAALFFGLTIVGAAAFVGGGKMLWQRARPSSIYQGFTEFSFPSGHAAMAMALLGFLSLLIVHGTPKAWRRFAVFVCLAGVFIISFSRIYLGAHWFTDVAAGLIFGLVLRRPRLPGKSLTLKKSASVFGGWSPNFVES